MNPAGTREFALNPAAYGLPTRDELVKLRIWDMHYHGFFNGGIRSHEENMFYVERMGIERMLSLDIAGSPDRSAGDDDSRTKRSGRSASIWKSTPTASRA